MTGLNGNAEFALHFHKRRATGGEDRYTIGRWKGTVLRAICHDASLDAALARFSFRNESTSSMGTLPTSTLTVDISKAITDPVVGITWSCAKRRRDPERNGKRWRYIRCSICPQFCEWSALLKIYPEGEAVADKCRVLSRHEHAPGI